MASRALVAILCLGVSRAAKRKTRLVHARVRADSKTDLASDVATDADGR